ncbi:MAG: tetratricopeptide repeat protein [Sideroxydans sp.]|nr:tetratricopeptide repeat protein [Sideroxydans sp.]
MHSLITFATQWGSKHGGINSFNTDFLKAFGIAFHNNAQVICIVADATSDEIEEAKNSYVNLVKLPYPPKEKIFSKDQAQPAIDQMKQLGISFEPEHTIWLGHDRITGAAAIEAARIAGGRSALIHHMSYSHYESFAENSQTADQKYQEQLKLFKQADEALAVGPLLRDAAQDMVKASQTVHMLVPGLTEEIEVRTSPNTFVAFLSGRLSKDAARIKQGHLGIAAFAQAHKKACQNKMPDGLCNQPKLMLRGVDFEAEVSANPEAKPEAELKEFAEKYAERAINLQALPYTHNREELYDNISRASVVLMPSWHEGFGLTAWEAIAAGVPLIVSQQSGVYRLLDDKFPGTGTGCVYPVDVRGSNIDPFFRAEDLESVAEMLKVIAHQPEKARQKAASLRSLLLNEYTWASCAEQAAKAFAWDMQKGSITSTVQQPITPISDNAVTSHTSNDLPVSMPQRRWKAGNGIADSQLLRAEEALVPFDPARQPELDKLNTWLDDVQYPQAVRLITGAGGLGKTRLALHLCQQRISSGWYAGFLESDLSGNELASGWKALKALNQPLLIVIDYAETRQDSLLALLRAMLQSPADQPVRLLLLARNGGEWWDNLPGKDKTCESLLGGYATSGPYHLPPLHSEIQDRRIAYQLALNTFAKALNVPAPDVIPELVGEHFGRPLYLQMAALLALHGERPTTAQGLTRALLNHERRYWRGLFVGHDLPEAEHNAEQLLALTTLAGGFPTPRAALPYWELTNGKAILTAQFNHLFNALIPLYPGKQGLQAVRPDLLGEALVAQALLRPTAIDLLKAVLGKDASQPIKSNALTALARLSDHYPELNETLIEALVRNFTHCWQEFLIVATETPSNLPVLAEASWVRLPSNTKDQLAGLLETQVTENSVQLAQFNCLVTHCLMEKLRNKHLKNINNIQALSEYANALNKYANSLNNAGRGNEALPFTCKSLKIYQGLAEKQSKNFMRDFAGLLSNYANGLASAGRNNEALNYSEQSLIISKKLAQKNPEQFDPLLALSLNNYANRLSDAGHDDEVLAHTLQALLIRKRLAHKKPDRFEPDLALSLDNYAIHLSYAGHDDEALSHSQQGLDINQWLAQKNLDRFEPNLAVSLNNYAGRLSDVGRNEDALRYSQKALEIRQRLAQKNPARFAEDQFSSVCQLYFMEWLAGKIDGNCDLAELKFIPEAISLHRRPLLQLFSSAVQGCCTPNQAPRSDAFKQVVALWSDLSRANRTIALEYWLCATAWCATHEPSAVSNVDWQTEWRQFVKRRQGRVPCWMQTVAQRLEFKWPE